MVAAAIALLVLIGGGLGAYKLIFETKDGTLHVEVNNDPETELRFKDGKLEIVEKSSGKLMYTLMPGERDKKLPVGEYQVRVLGADGVDLNTTEFKITRRGESQLRVTAKPPAVAANKEPQTPKPPAGDKPPSKGHFPGELVEYETFDDPKATSWLQGTKDGVKFAIENGAYVISAPADAGRPNAPIGSPIADSAFALRLRSAQNRVIDFRLRQAGDRFTWLSLTLFSDGNWRLDHRAKVVEDGKHRPLSQTTLKESSRPDSALAGNQWLNIAGRAQGDDYEVWLNGVSVAGGKFADPAPPAGTTSTPNWCAVNVETSPPKDQPFRFELDYVAIWKLKSAASDSDRRAAEGALALGALIKISLGEQEFAVRNAEELPREPFKLRHVIARNKKEEVHAALADCLKDCRNLTLVDTTSGSGAGIRDETIAYLQNCPELRHVYLSASEVTDKGLAVFKNSRDLEEFELRTSRSAVTAGGLANLRNCNKLTSLVLSNVRVTDLGILHFKDCTQLSKAKFFRAALTDTGVNVIAGWPELKSLDLNGNDRITDTGLAKLTSCQKLTYLNVRGNKNISETGVKAVSRAIPGCKIEWDGGVIEPTSVGGRVPAAIVDGGDWRMDGDELVQAKPGVACLMFGDRAWIDYDVTVETQTMSGVDKGQGALLYFRATVRDNYMNFNLGSYGGTWDEVAYMRDGKWGRDVDGRQTPHQTDRWYRMDVHVRGKRIQCSLDGKQLFDCENDQFPAGFVGLGTWNTAIRWRNLKVTAPDGQVLYAGFPTLPKDRFTNAIGMQFALVPKGKSWLGGGHGKPGEKEIEFKDNFYIGVYPVAQEEWAKVMGSNPAQFSRNGHLKEKVKDISDADLKRFPVEGVSYADVQAFLAKLNERDKQGGWEYRLPTSAEWEYACRGGPLADKSESAFNFYLGKPSNDLPPDQANFAYKGGPNRTVKVGQYPANKLGIHDMHGLVLEWCSDASKNNIGEDTRLARGGSWNDFAGAAGGWLQFLPAARYASLGLRVVRAQASSGPAPSRAKAPFDDKQAKAHQEEWATHLRRNVVEQNSLDMKMTLIPPGKFRMGNADAGEKDGKEFPDEGPAHDVEITRPYFMSATEVSQEQFEKILGRNASGYNAKGVRSAQVKDVDTKTLPVEMVTWFDALEFCNKLSEKEGLSPYYDLQFPVRHKDGAITAADVKVLGGTGYRLPTEAEWEYACRAGTITPYSFKFDYGTLGQYGWFGYIERPHAVGERKPNAFGLCDMHGNVHEWCSDWLGPYSTDALKDPIGPTTGTERMTRGGAYNYLPKYARSAWRGHSRPNSRSDNIGFRVARFVSEPVANPVADADRRAAEWVLSMGGSVSIVQGDKPQGIEKPADLPAGAWKLVAVSDAPGCKITNAGLSNLAGCLNITFVDFRYIGVTDEGLAHISGLKGLNHLVLMGNKLTPDGLEQLKHCPDLGSLTLNHSPITDAHLAKLTSLSGLGSLHLIGTQVTGEGLVHLKELKNLVLLDLNSNPLTDAGLPHLAEMRKLQSLALGGTKVSDKGLVHLKSLVGLRRLYMGSNNIGDVGLTHLKHLKNLEVLGLESTQVTNAGLAHLKELTRLSSLGLGSTQVTDAGIDALAECSALRAIYLTKTKVSAAGAKKLAAKLPACRIEYEGGVIEPVVAATTDRRAAEWVLSMGGFVDVRENGKLRKIRAGEKLPEGTIHLSSADVRGDKVTDAGLAVFKDCKNLTYLIVQSPHVTDKGLANFEECRLLEYLNLEGTGMTVAGLAVFEKNEELTGLAVLRTRIGDESIERLAGFKKLRGLNVKDTNITEAGAKKLKEALPKCNVEWEPRQATPKN